MITVLISVAIITAIAYVFARWSRIAICAICAGVSVTWIGIAIGILIGAISESEFLLPFAMLLGATVSGIAFQGEKHFTWAQKNIWLWKAPVIVTGLGLAFLFVNEITWSALLVAVVILGILGYFFFLRPKLKLTSQLEKEKNPEEVKRLMKKLEECC